MSNSASVKNIIFDKNDEIVENCVNIIDNARRKNESNQKWSDSAKKIVATKIQNFHDKSESIKFLLPSFPFKSTNKLDKVTGNLPDEGERVALNYFENFLNSIERVYPYGAEFHIFVDGFLFSDLLDVSDDEAEAYVTELQNLYPSERIKTISVFDFFPHLKTYAEIRTEFFSRYCHSMEEISALEKTSSDIAQRFVRVRLFMADELRPRYSNLSEQDAQKMIETAACEVVRRDLGLSILIDDKQYKDYVRLTRHAQSADSAKIGFNFLPGRHQSDAPWHTVLVYKKDGSLDMIKKSEAEAKGFSPVYDYKNMSCTYFERD